MQKEANENSRLDEHTRAVARRDGWHEFAAGVLRTGGILAGFVAFGLGWSVWLAPAGASGPPGSAPTYSPAVLEEPRPTPRKLWLIDGYNVVCANLLGGRDRESWWREEHRGELLRRLEHFDDPSVELQVVFDGSITPEPQTAPPSDRVQTVFAPDADRWLIQHVKLHVVERPVAVVTGDRKVASRARHKGAEVVTPRALLDRCLG